MNKEIVFESKDLSVIGLVLIAIISLIHTTTISLSIVLPIIIVLVLNILDFKLEDLIRSK